MLSSAYRSVYPPSQALASALLTATFTQITRTISTRPAPRMSAYPTTTYTSRHSSFPYTPQDFTRLDSTPDPDFYAPPRFVTHIDDNAIAALRTYYSSNLPQTGRILDLCSSWISHLPENQAALAEATAKRVDSSSASKDPELDTSLEVIGLGMNRAELDANPVLSRKIVKDLNAEPRISLEEIGDQPIDAATCVVSIDYLTKPVEVLTSVRQLLTPHGMAHLVLSNRCFPTKAVARWLQVDELERTRMVGDYLWWSGHRDIEIITVVDGRGGTDPLWVVRGKKE
jgi:hypothetical protein